MSSLNKVTLIGNLGRDPEIKAMQSGSKAANLTIATSENWKDKTTGERKEKTEWHKVVIFNESLVGIVERYLKKGSKVYLEGQLETRKWFDDKSGTDKYSTEIVIKAYKGEIVILSGKDNDDAENLPAAKARREYATASAQLQAPIDDMGSDSIPF